MMKNPNTPRTAWEPGLPIAHIQHVWEYVKTRLNSSRHLLHSIDKQYHGYGTNRDRYERAFCEALLKRSQGRKNRRHSCDKDDTLLVEKFRIAINKLAEVHFSLTSEVIELLVCYCSNYQAFGIGDDRLFMTYKSKMTKIEHTSEQISAVLQLAKSPDIDKEYLRVKSLSRLSTLEEDELLCQCEEGHVITRIVPTVLDLLQRLCDRCFDWLSTDQMYIAELKDQIAYSKSQKHDIEKQIKIAKSLFAQACSELKKERLVLECLKSELKDFTRTEIHKTERKLRMSHLEIKALERMISATKEPELGVPDCCQPDEPEAASACSTSDLSYYKERLEHKKEVLSQCHAYLGDLANLQRAIQESELRIKQLIRNSGRARKEKHRLNDILEASTQKLSALESLHFSRIHPESN